MYRNKLISDIIISLKANKISTINLLDAINIANGAKKFHQEMIFNCFDYARFLMKEIWKIELVTEGSKIQNNEIADFNPNVRDTKTCCFDEKCNI